METYDMGAGIMVVCGKKTLVLKEPLTKETLSLAIGTFRRDF